MDPYGNSDSERGLAEELKAIYHHFHEYPELGFQEEQTRVFIADYLEGLGFQVDKQIAKTGLVAVLKGNEPGPSIAWRADMDALPIMEETGLSYCSTNQGIMHACGHDVHMTCALGAAKIIAEEESFPGSVILIFQPAEEINAGAKTMIDDGLFERYKIDMIFGLHNQPDTPSGKVAIKEGGLMAAVDRVEISIKGKGGHGGVPHRNVDPVLATASVIMNLQSIVSRNVDPLDTAVISLGTLHGGTANNIIPDSIEMTGTVRTFNPETRKRMESSIRRVVENSASAFGCKGEVDYIYQLPAVTNPPELSKLVYEAAAEMIGENNIVDPTPSTGGEDFSLFQERVPGCFFWLGVGNPDKGAIHPWHSPLFRIDEDSLIIGARVAAEIIRRARKELS